MAIELTQEINRRITTVTEDTRETTFLLHTESTFQLNYIDIAWRS